MYNQEVDCIIAQKDTILSDDSTSHFCDNWVKDYSYRSVLYMYIPDRFIQYGAKKCNVKIGC